MISLGFSNLELIFTVSSCIPTWIFISSLSSRCLWFHSLCWGSLSDLCVSSVHDLGLATTSWTCYHWFLVRENSRDLATPPLHGFPAKCGLRNEHRNSPLMTCYYPELGSVSDWFKTCFNLSKKTTTQIWIVTCHRMDSALLSQTSFCRKTVAAIAKCQPFSQA